MTIFIAGGSGLLGRCLSAQLKKLNITSYFSRFIENGVILNYNDTSELYDFFVKNNIT